MPSPTEQYFEEVKPAGKSRLWLLLLGACIVVVLLGWFAKSTLPGQRSELIGKWQEIVKPQLWYDFRADGTYTASVLEEFPQVRTSHIGAWKASATALYLTPAKIEATNTRKELPMDIKNQIGRERKVRIEWLPNRQWQIQWRSDQTFQKAPR